MTSGLVQEGYEALKEMDEFAGTDRWKSVEVKFKILNWRNLFTDVVLRLEGLESKHEY